MTQAVIEDQLAAALGAIELPTPTRVDRPISGLRRDGRLNLGLPRPALMGPGGNLDVFGLTVAMATTMVLMAQIVSITWLVHAPASVCLAAWIACSGIGYLGYATTRMGTATGRWVSVTIASVEPGMWVAPTTEVSDVAQVQQVTAAQFTGAVTLTYRDGISYARPRDTAVAQFIPNR
ncbi:hypothetical protein [Rhodococcus zopfii]|uniref:hypothetical protein n=1 Tax=Rhodococcus zopfii TaxID=43772 RepID=UPI000934736F|nr:hypothetical protein [Rhodococcus zopfii]